MTRTWSDSARTNATRTRRRKAIRRELQTVVDETSGCIVWMGSRNSSGYGMVNLDGTSLYVHRLAAALRYGGLAEGQQVDHLCRNPSCYNPEHLDLVTPKENSQRGLNGRLRTTCPHGHPLDGVDNRGHRFCRACGRERNRKARVRA